MTPRNHDPNPRLLEHMPGVYMVMGETAEVVAKRYKISRQVQDEYALLSQQRTARAQREGFFQEEIAPMRVVRATLDKKTNEIIAKEEVCADKDECNRPDTTLDGLLALKPHFDQTSGQGTVTAGKLFTAFRRRVGHVADVAASVQTSSASPTSWFFAASR